MNATATLIVLWGAIAGNAWAHQDRILTLLPNGAISGIPGTYAATRLHVQFSKGVEGRLSRLALLSSNRETSLPECLLRLVGTSSAKQLSLSGSWYHSRGLLPHYLNVWFQEDSAIRDPQAPVTTFLFSLEDSSLLEVVQQLRLQNGFQRKVVKLVNGCPAPQSEQ